MNNLFQNAFLETESHTRTYKDNKLNNMSDFIAGRKVVEQEKNKEQQAVLESLFEEETKENNARFLQKKIINAHIHESQLITAIDKLNKQGKDALFKDILFEVFYKSLYIDRYFLDQHKKVFRNITDSYINDNDGFALLENSVIKTKSPLLKTIKTGIEKIVRENCARRCKETKDSLDIDAIDFSLNEDEQQELDYLKKDLNIDEISDLVKDKVLSVVMDEKQRKQNEDELIQNIENDIMDNDNVTDEDSMKEALSRIVINKTPVQKATLFDALFRDSYHTYLAENVATQSTDHLSADEEDIISNNYDTDQDSIVDAIDGDPRDDINMDEIFTEAITKYTMMETLYTLKLEDYPYDNIKKLTEKLVNVK